MPIKALLKHLRRTFILCAAFSFSSVVFADYVGPAKHFNPTLTKDSFDALFTTEIGSSAAISQITRTYLYNDTSTNITNIKFTATVKTGYHFTKWEYRESSGKVNNEYTWYGTVDTISSNPACFSTGIPFGVRGCVKLTAFGAANTYTIKYAANGGSGTMANQVMTYGKTAALTANAFTKSGYHFVGWSYNNKTYTDKQSISNLTSANNVTLTFTALWEKNKTYTVYFNSNSSGNSVGQMNNVIYTSDVSYTLPANQFVRSGYSFQGWALEATGSVVYKDNATVENITQGNSITLYAKWKPNTYTVMFSVEGGTALSTNKLQFEYDSLYRNFPTTNRAGYRFVGWYTKPVGGEEIKVGSTVKITSDITLYAQWIANTYTVKFNSNGGNAPSFSSKSVTYDSLYGDLPICTHQLKNASFAGWYTASTDGYKIESTTKVSITSAQTLYAHWRATTYMVKFDANYPLYATGVMPTLEITYGKETILPTNVFKVATMKFSGWSTAPNSSVIYADKAKVLDLGTGKLGEVVTLYANWECKNAEELDEFDYYASTKYLEFGATAKTNWEGVNAKGVMCIRNQPLSSTYNTDQETVRAICSKTIKGPGKLSFHYLTSRKQIALPTYSVIVGTNVTSLAITKGEWAYKTIDIPAGDFSVNFEVKTAKELYEKAIKAYGGSGKYSGDLCDRLYLDNISWTATGDTLPKEPKPDGDPDPDSTLVEVEVTFDSTIKGLSPSTSESKFVVGNAYGALPTCTREGYTFIGWYDGETKIESTSLVKKETNHTLKAKWQANTYTIRFDSNGGAGTMSDQKMTYDVVATLKPNSFVRSNYDFVGWSLAASASVAYANTASVMNLASTSGGIVTLFAKWKKVTTVSIDVDLTPAVSGEKVAAWRDAGGGVWQSACVDKADDYKAKLSGSVEGKGKLTFSYKRSEEYISAITYRLELNGMSYPLTATDWETMTIAIDDGAKFVFVVDGSNEEVLTEISSLYSQGLLESYEDDELDMDRLWIKDMKWTKDGVLDDDPQEKFEITLSNLEPDEIFKLPANPFTAPEGKRFVGWQGSNGRRYDDGMLIFNPVPVGEILTITAIWE